MKKISMNQIFVWVAQAAVIGFMIPTLLGFFISSQRMLTLEGSFFLMPVIIGLIGFSVIGESISLYVMGMTLIILLIMLICVLLFKRALKYGIFLFAMLLLDLTTMFAWYKSEVFSVGYVTFSFIIHLIVMGLLTIGMIAAYRMRVVNLQREIEIEERVEAEVEFEVESKLCDPLSETKENTDGSVSSDS